MSYSELIMSYGLFNLAALCNNYGNIVVMTLQQIVETQHYLVVAQTASVTFSFMAYAWCLSATCSTPNR